MKDTTSFLLQLSPAGWRLLRELTQQQLNEKEGIPIRNSFAK